MRDEPSERFRVLEAGDKKTCTVAYAGSLSGRVVRSEMDSRSVWAGPESGGICLGKEMLYLFFFSFGSKG